MENFIFKIILNTKKRLIFKILGINFSIRKIRLSKRKIKLLNLEYEQGRAKTPIVLNVEKTMQELISTNKSIVRYGDGEFNLIFGDGIFYQDFDVNLQKNLKEILLSNDENLMIGIPDAFGDLSKHNKNYIWFWQKYMAYNRQEMYKILDLSKTYYDAFVSRFYMQYLGKTNSEKLFKDFQKIWENKDVVLIEGEFSRLGYNNDLLDNTKSLKRILCPSKNAYSSIDKIEEVCNEFSKDTLFIIALGPAATVLAYRLHKKGYRALDLGHIDVEYEWFKQKALTKIPIKDKYVNDAKNGRCESELKDTIYQSQIYQKIL